MEVASVSRANLGPPRLPADLVSRPRLLRRLDGWAGMLCVVAAPAGFGKTTLLAEWASKARRDGVAWLSLDEAEAAPSVFWSRVGAALGAPGDGGAEASLAGECARASRRRWAGGAAVGGGRARGEVGDSGGARPRGLRPHRRQPGRGRALA